MSLSGTIDTITISGILQLLGNESKTGILSVKSHGIEFQIYFDDGSIIHAIEPLTESRLGSIMLNEGAIDKEDYEKALQLAKKKKQSLAHVLVGENFITVEKLKEYIFIQIQEIIFSMLCCHAGEFEYHDCNYNTKWIFSVKLNTFELVTDALRRLEEN